MSASEHRDLRILHRLRMELREACAFRDPEAQQVVVLREYLHRCPFLVTYLRLAKDTRRDFGITSLDAERAPAGEMRATLRGPLELLTMFAEQRCKLDHRAPVWGAYLDRIPDRALRDTANCLLDRNLRCRLSLETLNRALRAEGFPIIPG